MEENLNLKDLPKESGVYWFKDVDGEVIYVGSSKNLKNRFAKHLDSIRHPEKTQSQKELYNFLSKNSFTVEYLLEENYRQKEQELIDEFRPIFNQYRSFTGITSNNDNEYYREWHKQYRQEHLNLMKDYTSQLCFFEDEFMSFNSLRKKLKKMGFEHPCKMAKEYLVPQNAIEGIKLLLGGLEKILEK